MLAEAQTTYVPDPRLRSAYHEANKLDEAGMEALCPSYIELSEAAIRYRHEQLIGRGAIKDVFRAYDSRTRRRVAMAKLRENLGPEFYEIFVHEAWLTSSLNHPNIIKVYDVGVDGDGRPFFTMDLKGNTTLSDLSRRPSPPDLRDLLTILVKICEAVAYAHSRGVLHLDLKPENIQVDDFGEVLVCDWGLGRLLQTPEDSERFHDPPPAESGSWSGSIKGSPGYMAPEQARPAQPKDHRTDIYALGCLLHFVLTGEAPFSGTPDDILAATTRGEIKPLRQKFPDRNIPASLEAVALKATALHPQDRYQSTVDLCDEISNYLRGYATRAEQPGFFREARLFLIRNRVPATISFAAMILLTCLCVLFIQRLGRQRLQTEIQQNRASRLESKAESLAALYQGEIDQATAKRTQLAGRLAASANSLKNFGIFASPIKSLRETGELVEMALILDPECELARQEGFTLDCITLNFASALKNPPAPHLKQSRYIVFCEAFPEFSFSQNVRPSISQLTDFFHAAAQIDPQCGPLMERILAYDMASRSAPQRAAPALFAMLDYLNGRNGPLECSLDPKTGTLLIKSGRDLTLRMPESWGASGRCLLRFLTFPNLVLQVSGRFRLSDLEQLPIETLDLTECGHLDLSHTVTLPQLREIRICQQQTDHDALARTIRTSKEYEIVIQSTRP